MTWAELRVRAREASSVAERIYLEALMARHRYATEAAKEAGIHPVALRRLLKRHGVTYHRGSPRGRGRVHSEELRRRAEELRRRGWKPDAIAAELGVSGGFVRRVTS